MLNSFQHLIGILNQVQDDREAHFEPGFEPTETITLTFDL